MQGLLKRSLFFLIFIYLKMSVTAIILVASTKDYILKTVVLLDFDKSDL